MLKNMLRSLEGRLYRAGFHTPESRYLIARIILLMDFSLALALPLAFFDLHLLWFAIGLTLAAHNFKSIAAFAHSAVGQQFSGNLVFRQFLLFNLRLFVTAVVLFVCIVLLDAPLWPLLLGLSSVVAVLAFWGLSRYKCQNLVTKNLRTS